MTSYDTKQLLELVKRLFNMTLPEANALARDLTQGTRVDNHWLDPESRPDDLEKVLVWGLGCQWLRLLGVSEPTIQSLIMHQHALVVYQNDLTQVTGATLFDSLCNFGLSRDSVQLLMNMLNPEPHSRPNLVVVQNELRQL